MKTIDTLSYTVKTEKKYIAYANFIIEAYDGIGVVRTSDPAEGLLEVLVAPDFESEFLALAAALGQEIPFVVLGDDKAGDTAPVDNQV